VFLTSILGWAKSAMTNISHTFFFFSITYHYLLTINTDSGEAIELYTK